MGAICCYDSKNQSLQDAQALAQFEQEQTPGLNTTNSFTKQMTLEQMIMTENRMKHLNNLRQIYQKIMKPFFVTGQGNYIDFAVIHLEMDRREYVRQESSKFFELPQNIEYAQNHQLKRSQTPRTRKIDNQENNELNMHAITEAVGQRRQLSARFKKEMSADFISSYKEAESGRMQGSLMRKSTMPLNSQKEIVTEVSESERAQSVEMNMIKKFSSSSHLDKWQYTPSKDDSDDKIRFQLMHEAWKSTPEEINIAKQTLHAKQENTLQKQKTAIYQAYRVFDVKGSGMTDKWLMEIYNKLVRKIEKHAKLITLKEAKFVIQIYAKRGEDLSSWYFSEFQEFIEQSFQ